MSGPEIENLHTCLSPEQWDEDENDIWSASQKPKLAKIQEYVEEFQVYGEHKKVRGLSRLDVRVPPLKDFLKVSI